MADEQFIRLALTMRENGTITSLSYTPIDIREVLRGIAAFLMDNVENGVKQRTIYGANGVGIVTIEPHARFNPETGERIEDGNTDDADWRPMSESPLDEIPIEVRHHKWPDGITRMGAAKKRLHDGEGSIWFPEAACINNHPFDEYQWRPIASNSTTPMTGDSQ